MATVKNRGNKRSSSGNSFFSSTATTLVFVALCIVGVYMLSTNSVVSPQSPPQSSTTSTATKTSTHLSTIADSARRKPAEGTKKHIYDDNPGNLPEDAIEPDDSNKSQLPKTSVSEEKYTGIDESTNSENKDDEDNVKDTSEGLQGKESEDEQEKQKDLETQTTEESANDDSAREDPKGDETHGIDDPDGERKPEANANKILEYNRGEGQNDNSDSTAEGSSHETTSNEDQKEQQGQSQEETEGAISDDQIQHDEASVSKNEDPVIQETTEESQHDEGETSQNTSSQEIDDEKQQNHKEYKRDSVLDAQGTGIPKESKESKKAWTTQAGQSENQKERRKVGPTDEEASMNDNRWKLCNVTAGTDYIPCLDNEEAIAKLHGRSHYEHRERHCPEDAPTCLVPLPEGYKRPVEWPQSRDKIWYHNVPHTKLAEVKGHQNWVKVTGEFLTFPGGGTQFIHGALHYIDFIQEALPDIAWGKHTRVILDVGCGVASFGGFLFDRDVLAMSFAPKDEHEAQVQFALERGIPAISAVMGTRRLPFPSKVFDLVHCARCRVPWHAEGGALLLELNRVLRPGGHFVWSATPVYQNLTEDVQIWKEMSALTEAMCWKLLTIKKDKLNAVGIAIFRKPNSNECYEHRKSVAPPMCKSDDNPDAAWYVRLQSCMHRIQTEENERGSKWPTQWPNRLVTAPYWLDSSQMGIYGKPAPEDFKADYEHWKQVVSKTYLNGLGISWSNVRNVMDMRAVYGGFAAVLKDLKVWVMNVVNTDSPDTLPIIYERGLFGIYHDWCESFSTYPRTYDLLHADHLFSSLKKRCRLAPIVVEVDRMLRPGGKLIVRDESSTVEEVENLLRSLHWEVRMTFSKNQEGMLGAQKTMWRPNS